MTTKQRNKGKLWEFCNLGNCVVIEEHEAIYKQLRFKWDGITKEISLHHYELPIEQE